LLTGRNELLDGQRGFKSIFLDAAAAYTRVVSINGLSDVQVKLFSCGNPDVKSIALDGIEDLLGIHPEHVLRSLEWCILK
jgi:hypothetical protein